MKRNVILLSIALVFSSCQELFLGEEVVNTPEKNFELFWKDFDQHYGLFKARGWNWDSIYTVYRPQVKEATSQKELWEVFKGMISYLDDSHTAIIDPVSNTVYESGSKENARAKSAFSLQLLLNKYLEKVSVISRQNGVYLYGKVKNKNIGYLFFSGVELENPDVIDNVLMELKQCDGIIFDLRNNTGGKDKVAAAVAGRFADGEHFIYTVQDRNGPGHNDFSEKKKYFTKKTGQQHFSKPVVMLTDRITVSAAEVLLLHMKSFKQVIQIGDTTAGDFSDVSMHRFLPNGWKYHYSTMMFLLPSGKSLDGIGHVPDIQISNHISDIQSGNDKVMERAIRYLVEK